MQFGRLLGSMFCALLILVHLKVAANPIAGKGTWETTLKARDMSGTAVALDDPSAAFFYDSTLNVTWLADWSLRAKSDWYSASDWAAGLVYGGYSDWRMPSVVDGGVPGCPNNPAGGDTCGFNPTIEVNGVYSEWAHLYFVTLGNISYCALGDVACGTGVSGPQAGWVPLANSAFFRDMQADWYWSGTQYPLPLNMFLFSTNIGSVSWTFGQLFQANATAVRAGDVLHVTSVVPEPMSLWLIVSGLAALGLGRRFSCLRLDATPNE